MKKIFLLLIVFVVLSTWWSCRIDDTYDVTTTGTTNVSDNINSSFTLFVNNKEVFTEYVKVDHEENSVHLPLIAIVKALGYTVTWDSDTEATITCGEKIYLLNIDKVSLYEVGGNRNFLGPIYGGKIFREFTGNDYIVDHASMIYLLDSMRANISIDYDTGIISITQQHE